MYTAVLRQLCTHVLVAVNPQHPRTSAALELSNVLQEGLRRRAQGDHTFSPPQQAEAKYALARQYYAIVKVAKKDALATSEAPKVETATFALDTGKHEFVRITNLDPIFLKIRIVPGTRGARYLSDVFVCLSLLLIVLESAIGGERARGFGRCDLSSLRCVSRYSCVHRVHSMFAYSCT
jgi:hypothetical protein